MRRPQRQAGGKLPCRRHTARFVARVAVLLALWPQPAAAYVPPAFELMRLWAQAPNILLRDATLTLARREGDGPQSSERLYLKRPERLRWQAGTARQPGPTWIVREGSCHHLGGEDAAKVAAAGDPAAGSDCGPLWASYLMVGGGRKPDEVAARLIALLQRHHIDVNVVSFGRIGDEVVYIIGARHGEHARAQIWLDKATLVPRRTFIAGAQDASGSVWQDLRLDDWQPEGGRWLPGRIEQRSGDQVLRSWQRTDVSINSGLPPKLFTWDAHHPR